jgi:hypothetical protein
VLSPGCELLALLYTASSIALALRAHHLYIYVLVIHAASV